MKPAAIGIRVHSGWGALVAVCGKVGVEEVIERSRVVIIDPMIPGMSQPYHFAERLEIRAAEKHIAQCTAASARLAQAAIQSIIEQLDNRGYRVVASAILLSSGRPLPAFAKILASHAMIHTADGEFFRQAFRDALERLQIQVTGIRERELDERAGVLLGKASVGLQQRINGMGSTLGPPWTKDQKNAALAAALMLVGG
jgi:hypothetical protein